MPHSFPTRRSSFLHPFSVSSLLIPRLGLLSWVMRVSTIYDWVALGLFAALIVLFLQRSASDGPEIDTIWHYLPPSSGCALVNYSGNEGKHAIAIALHRQSTRPNSRHYTASRLPSPA